MESKSYGLSLLQCYSDDEENASDDVTEDCKTEELPTIQPIIEVEPDVITESTLESMTSAPLAYRENRVDTSDSEDDSSSDESVLTFPTHVEVDAEEDGDSQIDKKNNGISKSKMLEDLGILDLAPLEDLKISVPEEECIPIGTIHSIIEPLVIVAAKKGCPAIDLDSVLFLDHGKTFLGQVFDVFGQVSEPMYMVRFNSLQDILDHGIQVGMEVYFAPRTRHTAYVFVDALFKQKGSDASWEHDQEPPEGCLDYSDDEEERRAKAAHRLKKNPRNNADEESPKGNFKKRQTKFQRNNRNQHQPAHQIHQVPVNPFYMMPPPSVSNATPTNSSSILNDLNNSQSPASVNSNPTQSDPSSAAYTYPPPNTK